MGDTKGTAHPCPTGSRANHDTLRQQYARPASARSQSLSAHELLGSGQIARTWRSGLASPCYLRARRLARRSAQRVGGSLVLQFHDSRISTRWSTTLRGACHASRIAFSSCGIDAYCIFTEEMAFVPTSSACATVDTSQSAVKAARCSSSCSMFTP
ncbi:MAG: hypothetical protein ACI856_001699 [Kiritimatiellia bacterium]|jgi:hypothetical protein